MLSHLLTGFDFIYMDYYFWGIILIPGILLGLLAQIKVMRTYHVYKEIPSSSTLTASELARKLLSEHNINDISIDKATGELSDYYNYKTKSVGLSGGVYNSNSIAALGIMAHEIGHVMQYKSNYFPLKFRNFLIPLSNFISKLLWPVIFLGIFFNFMLLFDSMIGNIFIYSGIIMFGLIALISLITLPVELNASGRAKTILLSSGAINQEEVIGVKKVLNAAALTYVAALIISLLNLLRFVIVFGNRRR